MTDEMGKCYGEPHKHNDIVYSGHVVTDSTMGLYGCITLTSSISYFCSVYVIRIFVFCCAYFI